MANTAVFSALVDYLNRGRPQGRAAAHRARSMNNHIGKGGHLSAQPMGALRDYVARDPRTEMPAVVNFPVLADNPYQIDVPALLDAHRAAAAGAHHPRQEHGAAPRAGRRGPPRSSTTPASTPCSCTTWPTCSGLVGPHFQEPFAEGADLVTGSTHKTFFGTQRGVVGRATGRSTTRSTSSGRPSSGATFPGSVSNHHLGTLLGLLMAAYEMNHFKDAYQQAVIANAKAFARAL